LSARRPNILFIVTDDQRYGTLDLTDPATGGPWMPNATKWFGGGTEFTSAFDTTPLCCPSRASLMAGQYAHNTGVITNSDKDKLDHATTLQCLLRSQEDPYYTGIFGKYLNNWVTLGGSPPQSPPYFDEWTIWDNGVHMASEVPPPRPDPPTIRGLDCVNDQGSLVQAPPGTYETTYLADKATDFIRRRAADPTTPWYLYLAPTPPHYPYRPEARYEGIPVPRVDLNASNAPEADVTDKPPYVQDQRKRAEGFDRTDRSTWPMNTRCRLVSTDGLAGYTECVLERMRPHQLQMLKSVDDMVERIFAALAETNQADDTLAFYTADHGMLWNEHGLDSKPHAYYDMRVPLLIRWPNGPLTATSDSSLVANIDLAPTVLVAAGVPVPAAVDGVDLLAPGRQPRDRLLLELGGNWNSGRWASLVTPGLQYTEYNSGESPMLWSDEYPVRADSPPGTHVREYYDLDADPLELRNLLHDGDVLEDPSDEVLEALQRRLANDRNCSGRGGIAGRPPCP
jgi:arylsulfatase A-like enzyme